MTLGCLGGVAVDLAAKLMEHNIQEQQQPQFASRHAAAGQGENSPDPTGSVTLHCEARSRKTRAHFLEHGEGMRLGETEGETEKFNKHIGLPRLNGYNGAMLGLFALVPM